MRWFDAGANLLDERFDIAEVLSNAEQAGVNRICLITTAPDEWEAARKLHQQYPDQLCYTLGVHPHNARLASDDDLTRLAQLASEPGVVAIGECGLDFNRNFSEPAVQIQVFDAQLAIAKRLNMPVYLHERDAFEQQLTCLNQCPPVGGIAHCFTGTQEQMQAYLALGLYIGITGWVCDPKRGEALQHAITQLPTNKLILETDAPYLFPKNKRPRKRNNEPANIPAVAEKVAEITGLSLATLSETSYANTLKLFRFSSEV